MFVQDKKNRRFFKCDKCGKPFSKRLNRLPDNPIYGHLCRDCAVKSRKKKVTA